MAYCTPNDLLVGDIQGLEGMKATFVTTAAEEMDAMIGFVYALPLGGVSGHVELLLKDINRKLASGRLLMAQAAAQEDSSVHAYGQSLVDEAIRTLWMIRNGQIDLGVQKIDSAATSGDAPVIIEGDTYSGVDAYYSWVSTPNIGIPSSVPIWGPGIV